eukprot:SAG31_NODE_637_length_13337_cov_23.061867_4_plen_44_part_00
MVQGHAATEDVTVVGVATARAKEVEVEQNQVDAERAEHVCSFL